MTDRAVQTAAAIDIGSNSVKLTVGRRVDGGIEEFYWDSETVRLGAGIDETGRLAEERMAAGLATLARFAATARALGAERTLAVATEALRVAANGRAFLELVERETGIETEIVDGDREAALTFAGLATTIDLRGDLVVADIGGASAELIGARDGRIIIAWSVPIGSGRLTDRFVHHDPPLADELRTCRQQMGDVVRSDTRSGSLARGGFTRLTLVGGTGEYLGKLVDPEQPLSTPRIDRVLERLTECPAATLAPRISASVERARVLPAGIAIAAAMAEFVDPRSIEVARSGIRSGLLLEALGAPPVAE